MDLNDDPRWRRFNDTSRPCPCCGRRFDGVFDIGYDHPDPWPHGNRSASGEDVLQVGEDGLTADYCSWGQHRFIRAVLPLPIRGSDKVFAFGPWGSVNPANYDRYIEASLGGAPFEGSFAWLMNKLPGFEFDDWLPCNLVPGAAGQRPVLEVHDGSHDLARLQEEGITFDQLLDIYAAAGQDIRPHLLDG
ncbi:DUF2199 domain-containing protein [Alphaproteobacteria bacterium GH1-50]|uniref:DUF2199 domain-containing protein n=1 Tax=Kangsaoukella pontilimi TaxID=2691042 RepID=A0A7C9IP05_9RHOB|nr:DUF2199 domain-containing protein [Kangsaoukella pontilimi]MXQ07730.1 DUF2199 domain-containing protein [Kangsaoukella pontilimi]